MAATRRTTWQDCGNQPSLPQYPFQGVTFDVRAAQMYSKPGVIARDGVGTQTPAQQLIAIGI
jgi:hypothetical protein